MDKGNVQVETLKPFEESLEVASQAVKVRRLFNQAERAIRRNERLTLAFPVAPVNQLRYAGFHLARSAVTQDNAVRLDELKKAENHCLRAWFDAFDDIVVRLLDFVREFQLRKFPEEAVLHYYPAYETAINIVIAAQGRLESSSKVQAMGRNRAVALLQDARKLSRIRRHLLYVQSKLDGILELRQKVALENKARRRVREFCMSLAISTAGVVLSAIGLGVALFQRGVSFWGYVSCAGTAAFLTLVVYYILGSTVFASQWGAIRNIDDIVRLYTDNKTC